MKTYTCFTSMNVDYYNDIGKYMVESWSRWWADDFDLYIWFEGNVPDALPISNNKNIFFVNWNDRLLDKYLKFTNVTPNNNERKFAKKALTFIDAKKYLPEVQNLLWLDADLLSYKLVTEAVITTAWHRDKLIGLFQAAEKGKSFDDASVVAAESGFVLLNTRHKHYNSFMELYEQIYTSGIKPKEIKNFYDGEVLRYCSLKWENDTDVLNRHMFSFKTQNPMSRTFLHDYIWHFKTKSKNHIDREKIKEIILGNHPIDILVDQSQTNKKDFRKHQTNEKS